MARLPRPMPNDTFRYAFRSLRRSPGFVAIATLSLGLALGLNTVTYGILDAVRYPYVPYADADRLFEVVVWGDGLSGRVGTVEKYAMFREGAGFHNGLAAFSLTRDVVQAGQSVDERTVALVTANFFPLLGVRSKLGRTFRSGGSAAAAEPGDATGVIVSAQLWRRSFPGRTSLDSATVTVGDRRYAVIGVMPRGMAYPWGTHLWLLMPPRAEVAGEGLRWIVPVVRLKPGDTPEAAAPELEVLAGRLASQYGTGSRPFQLELRSIRPSPLKVADFHFAMGGAALAVLLIACANLANLMLARGMTKRRELALRMALGASRGGVTRLMLAECALIALAGGALGLLLSLWGMQVVTNLMPPDVAFVGLLEPRLSWRVFAFGLAAAGATVLLFGVVPAVRASDVDVSEPLKDGAGTTTVRARHRFSALVVAEIALSMVLLMGAGLLAKAAQRVSAHDFGYDPRRLWAAAVNLRRAPKGADIERLFGDLLERARRLHGVRSAATMRWGTTDGNHVTSELEEGGGRQVFLRYYNVVSPDFLRTLGIRVVEGRDFVEGDREVAGAVILDDEAARQLWPHGGAVGRMIKLGELNSRGPWVPVVGIVRGAALFGPGDPDLPPEPTLYVVRAHDSSPERTLIIRTGNAGAEAAMSLRREIQAAAPWAPPRSIRPWLWYFTEMVAARHFMAGLFALFGLFALLLSAVGLYGVLAYSVSHRTREFGVRVALGARPRDLLALVLRDALVMVLAGTGVGAVLAMWSAKLLGTWLYTVHPTDALTLVSAEAVLVAVALAACVAPAVQATRADPLHVLRAT